MTMWKFLLKRLSEPSSAAGIAALIVGGSTIANGDYATGISTVLAGVGAVLIPEQGGSPGPTGATEPRGVAGR
jgi:hypothetical protein